MNTIAINQTATYLTRHIQRWDRRVKLLTSLVWGPRALILGVMFGIALAVISRFRPWYLPGQILLATVLVCIALLIGSLGWLWLWPRSVPRRAQHFDYRFDLKERVSTALELAGSALPVPAELRDRQLQDAVGVAEQVDVRAKLPVRLRWLELAALVFLIIVFAYLLLLPNPKTDELLAQRQWQNTLDAQVDDLENAIERIESNPELSEAEQQALTDPLNEALDILNQENVSQQEAVAALAEAQQSLDELSDGMTSDQETAYQDAASELAGSEMTSDLAEGLNKPDLGQTADALEQLAEDIGEQDMTQAEREGLAESLEAAAEQLEESNPALAEKLREAAQALREDDTEAAQEALREAAEMLRQQQERLENSELAQSAQDAQQQVQQSQQEIAGTEQEGMMQQDSGQSGQPQPSESGSQAGSMPEQAQQEGQEGDQAQQSGQSPAGEQADGESEGAGAPSQSEQSQGQGAESESAEGGASGTGAEPSEGQSQQSEAAQGGETEGSSSSLTAGEGEGGEGSDTTMGNQSSGEGGVPQNSTSEGDFEAYDPSNAPSSIGGESDDVIDVGGEAEASGDDVLREGEIGPNPAGESSLTYSGVFSNFGDIISAALESGRIPLDQRDVIHDYFSSLDQ